MIFVFLLNFSFFRWRWKFIFAFVLIFLFFLIFSFFWYNLWILYFCFIFFQFCLNFSFFLYNLCFFLYFWFIFATKTKFVTINFLNFLYFCFFSFVWVLPKWMYSVCPLLKWMHRAYLICFLANPSMDPCTRLCSAYVTNIFLLVKNRIKCVFSVLWVRKFLNLRYLFFFFWQIFFIFIIY